MVCPMRFVLAFISVIVLGYAVIALLYIPDDIQSKRIFKQERTWFRFFIAFFTGELLGDYYGFSIMSYFSPSKDEEDNKESVINVKASEGLNETK